MTISTTTPEQPDDAGARVFQPDQAPTFRRPGVAIARRRMGGLSPISLLLALAAAVAIAGVAFAVGRTTSGTLGAGTGATTTQGGAVTNQDGAFPGGAPPDDQDSDRVAGRQTITGTVSTLSDGTLTIQLADGRTVQVAIGSSTTFHAQAAASPDQVTAGSQVIVTLPGIGQPGDVGSGTTGLTATDVTIAGS